MDLRPQDDRERFVDKHQRKSSLICHSAADEESPILPNLSLDVFILFKIKEELNEIS
ncbi:MAG: hypothetical protein JHC31_14620 [Sulfurihydrogenibium sp.]|nr:hypothetical protein [Sulfurihydrogenibium sp.]